MYSDPDTQRLRSALSAAKGRCYNPDSADYRWYGARGVRICKDWLESPATFVAWALDNGYKHGLYLDRKNTARNYSPANCQWVTPLQSTRNRRGAIFVTHQGVTHALIDWAIEFKLTYKCIYQRYENGVRPPELFAPSRRNVAHKPCRVATAKKRPNRRGCVILTP